MQNGLGFLMKSVLRKVLILYKLSLISGSFDYNDYLSEIVFAVVPIDWCIRAYGSIWKVVDTHLCLFNYGQGACPVSNILYY